jgi:hypothetical protein
MAGPTVTKPQKRVLVTLLGSDPEPVAVRDLAVDPARPGTAWGVVQALRASEPKALVKVGKATGDLVGTDNSTVSVSLTVAGRNAARALQ